MRQVHPRLADALSIARESIAAGPAAALDPLTCCWAICAVRWLPTARLRNCTVTSTTDAYMTMHIRYEEKRLLGIMDDLSPEVVTSVEAFGPLA